MSGSVLLVHDDIASIAAVRRLLVREGYEVILATSAADAIIAFGHYAPVLVVLAPAVEGGRGRVVLDELAHHPDHDNLRLVLLGGELEGTDAPVVPFPLDGSVFLERVTQALQAAPVVADAPSGEASRGLESQWFGEEPELPADARAFAAPEAAARVDPDAQVAAVLNQAQQELESEAVAHLEQSEAPREDGADEWDPFASSPPLPPSTEEIQVEDQEMLKLEEEVRAEAARRRAQRVETVELPAIAAAPPMEPASLEQGGETSFAELNPNRSVGVGPAADGGVAVEHQAASASQVGTSAGPSSSLDADALFASDDAGVERPAGGDAAAGLDPAALFASDDGASAPGEASETGGLEASTQDERSFGASEQGGSGFDPIPEADGNTEGAEAANASAAEPGLDGDRSLGDASGAVEAETGAQSRLDGDALFAGASSQADASGAADASAADTGAQSGLDGDALFTSASSQVDASGAAEASAADTGAESGEADASAAVTEAEAQSGLDGDALFTGASAQADASGDAMAATEADADAQDSSQVHSSASAALSSSLDVQDASDDVESVDAGDVSEIDDPGTGREDEPVAVVQARASQDISTADIEELLRPAPALDQLTPKLASAAASDLDRVARAREQAQARARDLARDATEFQSQAEASEQALQSLSLRQRAAKSAAERAAELADQARRDAIARAEALERAAVLAREEETRSREELESALQRERASAASTAVERSREREAAAELGALLLQERETNARLAAEADEARAAFEAEKRALAEQERADRARRVEQELANEERLEKEVERFEAEKRALLEREREEKERLAQEVARRLEEEREEKERLAVEAAQTLERERLEKERLAQEAQALLEERERLEREREEALARERAEATERLTLEREQARAEIERTRAEAETALARERAEIERLEREAAEQLEQVRADKERLAREAAEQLEQVRAEKARLERESAERLELARAENERLEQESAERLELARAEKERLEREREQALELARAQKERSEHEREQALELARAEKERSERERELALELARTEKERLEREAQQAVEHERLEKERLERETQQALELARADKARFEHEAQTALERERQKLALLTAEDEALKVRGEQLAQQLAAERERAEAERHKREAEEQARLEAEARAQEAAEKAEAALVVLPRSDDPKRRIPRAGRLSLEALAQLLVDVLAARMDVRIELQSEDLTRVLWLERGTLVGASSNVAHESVLDRARADGLLDARQASELRLLRGSSVKDLVETLRVRGYLREPEVVPLLQRHVEQIAVDALSEAESVYRFSEEPLPVEVPRVQLPRTLLSLLVEGLRRGLDPRAFWSSLGGSRARISLSPRPVVPVEGAELSERERRVLRAIDGEPSVEELLLEAGARQDTGLRVLAIARVLGWISVRQGDAQAPASDPDLDVRRLGAKYEEALGADYFTVLGLPRAAGRDEVQRAFSQLSTEFHPLRFSGHSDPTVLQQAERVHALLAEAAEALADDGLRALYARNLVD